MSWEQEYGYAQAVKLGTPSVYQARWAYTAFAAAVKCREEIFFGAPVVAITIVQIQRLAFAELMI